MIATATERIKAPEFLPCGSVEREQDQIRRGAVKHTINDQRVALNLRTSIRPRAAGLIRPCDLELVDVLCVDLFE